MKNYHFRVYEENGTTFYHDNSTAYAGGATFARLRRTSARYLPNLDMTTFSTYSSDYRKQEFSTDGRMIVWSETGNQLEADKIEARFGLPCRAGTLKHEWFTLESITFAGQEMNVI